MLATPLNTRQTPSNASSTIEDDILNTNVTVSITPPGIKITATTKHLFLRPAEESDVDVYQAIFSNPTAMAFFGAGKPRLYKDDSSKEAGIVDYAKDRLNVWCKRWKEGDPFSAMTIVERTTSNPIGCIMIGPEVSAFIDPTYWGKGYVTEAAIAAATAILPEIVLSGSVKNIPKSIVATVHPKNQASWKIIEKIGMVQDPDTTEAIFDGKSVPRRKYSISVEDLVKKYVAIKKFKNTSEPTNHHKEFLSLYSLKKKPTEEANSFNTLNRKEDELKYMDDVKKVTQALARL